MCTAISLTVNDSYFGRNLDYEHEFGEKVTITPRNFRFGFSCGKVLTSHYAIIGMALPKNNYPLYFDASNETGLSMAGLNFPDNAYYTPESKEKTNIASFEIIPFILSRCSTVSEAEKILKSANITDTPFDKNTPPSPLHWIIADKKRAVTLEQTKSGLKVYNNPIGVLTNNPSFEFHIQNLSNYINVTANEPNNRFSDKISLDAYSRGMGGIGLPGDLSSASRFVRACFTKLNSVFGNTEKEIVSQFFHILYSVYQTKGCAKIGSAYEMTNYSSCCNTDKGIYYYTTYYNSTINCVSMHDYNLDGRELYVHELAH